MTTVPAHGTLAEGEYHPAAKSAMWFIKGIPVSDLGLWHEALASVAISGDRNAELCSETLNRIITGQPVSDRYLLGLAWTIRNSTDIQGILLSPEEKAVVRGALRALAQTDPNVELLIQKFTEAG